MAAPPFGEARPSAPTWDAYCFSRTFAVLCRTWPESGQGHCREIRAARRTGPQESGDQPTGCLLVDVGCPDTRWTFARRLWDCGPTCGTAPRMSERSSKHPELARSDAPPRRAVLPRQVTIKTRCT